MLKPINELVMTRTQTSVLDSLLSRNCQVAMACGRQGICATCQVYVREGADQLTPPTVREQRTLALMTGATPQTRLACQAHVIGDGVVLELPEGMYLQDASSLPALVGRRTDVPILHPRTGKTLIPAGKIITRSRILELEQEDFSFSDLRHHTREV